MIMVDSIAHCEMIARAAAGGPIKVCLDVDASLRIGPLHLGVRRSPVHTAAEAYALAAEIIKRPELSLTGLMFYDAQIAVSWTARRAFERSRCCLHGNSCIVASRW
jgi:D-serine deaminase-like pyridoxal phosphate-dependent protein